MSEAESKTRHLLLLRHTKSDWEDPALSDHERPLSGRGREAAPRIGRYMARAGYAPGLVLCSSSRRTLETWERLLPTLPSAPRLEVVPDLYLASAATLLAHVQAAPDATRTLLVIAHNPGIAELAEALACRGDAGLRSRLRRKYPTGALAVFTETSPNWGAFRGELVDFVCPRELPEA